MKKQSFIKSQVIKRFFLNFKFLFLILIFIQLQGRTLYAFERSNIYSQAVRILQLSKNQGDYSSYAEMMELYQDMRDKIKTDLELGNIDTAIDYELFIEGLVLEKYPALQSVLGFNNYNDTTKEFFDELNHVYTQKLAYALKQNKIAFQTHFDVKQLPQQANCTIMVNGKKLKQSSFLGPAGISFYIGIYCPEEKLFEIKKIQAAESQKFYTISFNNLKPIIYSDNPVDMGVPNPLSTPNSSLPIRAQRKQGNFNHRLKLTENDQSFMQISFGAGVDWYATYFVEKYYRYPPATGAPILLYSSNQFVYKNFELVLDFGPVIKTTTADDVQMVQSTRTMFLRPIILFTDKIYQYKDLVIVNANMGLSTFFVGTNIQPISYGVKAGLEPKIYLSKPFFLGGDLGITYYFAGLSSNDLLVGFALRLGADF